VTIAVLNQAASSEVLGESHSEPDAACPPHYWVICQDAEGERWDCRNCAATKRPVQPRFITWGDRACTWTREERILAGMAEETS